jgi:predicted small lipoprotein YifL
MMKYLLLAAAVTALTLTACDGKKHPMDKPPPSASVERDSAPNFDDIDKPSTDGAAGSHDAGSHDAASGDNVKKEEPAK